MMELAKDSDEIKVEVQRLPQRVRRPLLPVERISSRPEMPPAPRKPNISFPIGDVRVT